MGRKRSRRRSDSGSWWSYYLVSIAIAVVVILGVGVPGNAFTTGSMSRGSSADTVTDINGVHNLNVTSELQEGSTGCLVEVTNYLGEETTVNVSLRNDSTDLGTLQTSVLDSVQSGDSVEFTLADGASQTVEMNTNSNTNGSTAYFDVRASGSDIRAEAKNRSAPIGQTADADCL